jgi:hypothetical protein
MNEENSSGLIPVTDHELFQATTARGFEPGQTIFNRFVLTRVLGRGGMGIVWLAHDTQLEQEVAIKVLPDVVMHDREAVTDMKRETKRSLQLNHHNIVRIYDFNQDTMGAGISMEFVDGETLSAAKADRPHGCFDVEDVAPWLEQICDALAYAHHTAKIVHRDLKPANIMLSKANVIKVTDFGIARSISDSISRVSMRHASSGTMVYMSPQQSSGARSSSSDDIYALGATIYDLLTGKPPFYSGNIQHQLENITPPRMIERRAELERHGNPIPEIWERAVASCLEKEPGRRPGSVMELAQMLNLRTSAPTITSAPVLPAFGRTAQDVATASAHARTAQPQTTPPSIPPGTPVDQTAPQPPREPFFTPMRLMIGGGIVGAIALVAIVLGLIAMLSRGHGTVAVTTDPPGATVTIDKVQMTSPATFDAVPAGDFAAEIELDGYDPVEVPERVAKNDRVDLPITSLKRSTGIVAITVIPSQSTCLLKMVESVVPSEGGSSVIKFDGGNLWQSPPLKTGKYELITSAAGFADGHTDIHIKRGDTQQIVVDLVKQEAGAGLGPDELAAVNSDDAIPSSLTSDDAAKRRLADYYRKAFEGYMQIRQFDLAESQLKHLKSDLGEPTSQEEKELADGRLVALKGQGRVVIKTDPAGGVATVDGKTLGTPAIFEKVLAGTKTIEVKLQGYATQEIPADVNRDVTSDLGTIELVRLTGNVEITLIPRHANGTLKLVHSEAPGEEARNEGDFNGMETYKASQLGTGTYSVTASGEGFAAATQTFDIKPDDTQKITLDLVLQDAQHLLTPELATIVNSDQPLPDSAKQDPAKTSLTAYYQQIFDGYLKLKEFKLAEAVLKRLSGDLGVASAQNQAQLDQLQTEWLTTEKTNLNQLIQQERFAEADALLKDMEAHGPQPDLRDALDKAKAAHEQAVTQALANVDALESAGNEAGAYKAAVDAASKDKIDPRLAIRVATLELAMPSTFDRVSPRVKAMNDMLAADPTLGQNAEFNRLLGIFQHNLDKHNTLRGQIAELKKEVNSYDGKISSLRADEKQDQDKANGYKMLNAAGIGGFFAGLTQGGAAAGAGAGAGATAAAIGANGANAREADVHHIQGEIDDLRSEQSAKQADLDQLKQQYDTLTQGPINATQ